jgi:mono/diheme cytochrome c family protein
MGIAKQRCVAPGRGRYRPVSFRGGSLFSLASSPEILYTSSMLRIGICFRSPRILGAMVLAVCLTASLNLALGQTTKVPEVPPLPFLTAGSQPTTSSVRTNRTALTRPAAPAPSLGSGPIPYLGLPASSPTVGPKPPLAPTPPRTYSAVPATPPPPLLPPNSLSWDSESKEHQAKIGETNAHFTFWLTNVCDKEVLVNSVRTSCGCTVAKLPETPWRIAPGSNGPIMVTVDLRGKRGKLTKTVTVDTTAGIKSLLVAAIIPADPNMDPAMNRSQNMQLALADRQVVFRGDCARCHVEPTRGKMGKELYANACGICHEAEHRASMVTDLKTLKHPTNLEYWTHWIKEGKPNSLMPAFAPEHGGPLTHDQIKSLAEWLTENYKGNVAATAGSASAAPASTPTPAATPATPSGLKLQ